MIWYDTNCPLKSQVVARLIHYVEPILKSDKRELKQKPARTWVSGTDIYPHMPILRPHATRFHGASLAWRLRWRIPTVMFTCGWAWPARSSIRPILGFWGSKVHKNGRFLPWTPVNRRAKYDTASFILGGEIRNHTKLQKTNSNRYIHTLPISMCG